MYLKKKKIVVTLIMSQVKKGSHCIVSKLNLLFWINLGILFFTKNLLVSVFILGVQNVEFILTGTIRQELDFTSFAYQ